MLCDPALRLFETPLPRVGGPVPAAALSLELARHIDGITIPAVPLRAKAPVKSPLWGGEQCDKKQKKPTDHEHRNSKRVAALFWSLKSHWPISESNRTFGPLNKLRQPQL